MNNRDCFNSIDTLVILGAECVPNSGSYLEGKFVKNPSSKPTGYSIGIVKFRSSTDPMASMLRRLTTIFKVVDVSKLLL